MRFLLFCLLLAHVPVRALTLTVGPQPLQRALVKQLFSAPDGRYYLRGKRDSPGCFLYAQDPHLRFAGNRVLLDLHLTGKVAATLPAPVSGWHGPATQRSRCCRRHRAKISASPTCVSRS